MKTQVLRADAGRFIATAIMVLSIAVLAGFAAPVHADGEIDADFGDYNPGEFCGDCSTDFGDFGGGCDSYCGDTGDYGDYGSEADICGCDENGDGFIEYEEYQDHYGGGSGGGQPRFSSFGGSSYRPISYAPPMTFFAPGHSHPSATTINNTNVNNNSNVNNNTAIAIATVAAAPQPTVQYVQYAQPVAAPYCTITLTNYGQNNYGPYAYNQLATLTWSSGNATSGYISPNVGNVSGYGSMQVYPIQGQTYTMTVYGQGGSATCQTQPLYIPVAPVVQTPYVSLSQIPYTGLDLGILGNVLYWLSLVTFAGAAAYLVLYFQGGALSVLTTDQRGTQIAMPRIALTPAPALATVTVKEQSVVSPIQLATRSNTTDRMQLLANAGEAPRIVISRE